MPMQKDSSVPVSPCVTLAAVVFPVPPGAQPAMTPTLNMLLHEGWGHHRPASCLPFRVIYSSDGDALSMGK